MHVSAAAPHLAGGWIQNCFDCFGNNESAKQEDFSAIFEASMSQK
jgi:hypothetical protein